MQIIMVQLIILQHLRLRVVDNCKFVAWITGSFKRGYSLSKPSSRFQRAKSQLNCSFDDKYYHYHFFRLKWLWVAPEHIDTGETLVLLIQQGNGCKFININNVITTESSMLLMFSLFEPFGFVSYMITIVPSMVVSTFVQVVPVTIIKL